MIRQFIAKAADRQDLTVEESRAAFTEIMEGRATEAQIAAFITALRMKGETVPEITGAALVMREKATRIDAGAEDVLDTCGTGGDAMGTFNISTAAALVAAAAGLTVAKHGNRSVTSGSGSAEVLQALGVRVDAPVPVIERCLREVRIGFLFAPKLHAAMKYAIGPRREIAVRTIFNILGPLTNPARANRQLLGVYRPELTGVLAEVLVGLGARHVMVVHGSGLDEIATTGPTRIAESQVTVVQEGETRSQMVLKSVTEEVHPSDFDLPTARLADLQVKGPEESAQAIREVFDGRPGPRRDIVLLNAGAALYVGGRAATIADGLRLAAAAVDDGRARETLRRLVEISQQAE
jgi:anthranilate phosphoribosyltransferase